jgi:hypothetical protein
MLLRLLILISLTQQSACEAQTDKPLLLLNPVVHTGEGTVIANAALAVEGSRIVLLADARRIRLDLGAYEVLQAEGLHVYPAVLSEQLPEEASDSIYYFPLAGRDAFVLSGPAKPGNGRIPALREGGRADLIVTDIPLQSGAPLRYLMIGGRLKREKNITLQAVKHREQE